MLTLEEAYQDYLRSRRDDLSPRSLAWTEQKVQTHLAGFLDRPLDQIMWTGAQ